MPPTRVLACLPLAILLGAAAPAWPVPFQARFELWVVTCDNTASCDVRTEIAPPPDRPYSEKAAFSLRLTRDAGSAGVPTLSLTGAAFRPMAVVGPRPPNLVPPLDPVEAGPVLLDSHEMRGAVWRRSEDGRMAMLTGQDATAFVRSLAKVRSARIMLSGRSYELRPAGLSAALARADAAQRRTGTTTALVSPGKSTEVPEPPELPVIIGSTLPPPLADPAGLASAVRAKMAGTYPDGTKCDPMPGVARLDWALPLTRQDALVNISCTDDPRNPAGFLMRMRRDDPASARLLDLPPNPPSFSDRLSDATPSLAIAPRYDPGSGRLQTGFLRGGRPGPTCGALFVWTLDGDAFVPSGASLLSTCLAGTAPLPVIFRMPQLP